MAISLSVILSPRTREALALRHMGLCGRTQGRLSRLL